ncbi:Exo-poly-alpha-D-galacturonosidase precursor [compost metagenome]
MTLSSSRRGFLAGSGVAGLVAAATTAAATHLPSRPITPVPRVAGSPAGPTLPASTPQPNNGLKLDPRAFGAVGDGMTKDTAALQAALDRVAVLGGGEVIVSPGVYLIGAVRLGSNTVLRIEDGATLQGSPDITDYPVTQVRWASGRQATSD